MVAAAGDKLGTGLAILAQRAYNAASLNVRRSPFLGDDLQLNSNALSIPANLIRVLVGELSGFERSGVNNPVGTGPRKQPRASRASLFNARDTRVPHVTATCAPGYSKPAGTFSEKNAGVGNS